MKTQVSHIYLINEIDEMMYDYIRESGELYGNIYKEYCVELLNDSYVNDYNELVPLNEDFFDSSTNSVAKFFKGLLYMTQVMIRNIITTLTKGTLKPHQFMKMHLSAVKQAMSENYMTNWSFDAYKFEGIEKIKPDVLSTINEDIDKNSEYAGYRTAIVDFIDNKDMSKLLTYLDSQEYAAFYKDSNVMTKLLCKRILNGIGVADTSRIDAEDNDDILSDFSELLYGQIKGEDEVTIKISDIHPDEMIKNADTDKISKEFKTSCLKIESSIKSLLAKLETLKNAKIEEDNTGKKEEVKKNQRRIVAAMMFFAKCERNKLSLLQATNNAIIKIIVAKAAQDAAIFKSILEFEPAEATKDKDRKTTTTLDNSNGSSGESSSAS